MGSANCKEYVTTPSNKDGNCTKPTNGTYQSNSDTKMDQESSSEIDLGPEYTEPVVVCQEGDIEENQMKAFDFMESGKVLVVKQNGIITAVGNKCPHYGAPLNTGALGLSRVRCPWHGATFDTITGDIEDFPGLDSLPCYNVRIEKNGDVKLRAKHSDLEKNKRLKDMVKRDMNNKQCIVVVGGGPAGGVCVETLRQEGFSGRILLICKENHRPYDRVKLSKVLNIPIESIEFRPQSFYDEYGIELLLGVTVNGLDTDKKVLYCSNTKPIKYDQLFLATGSKAHRIPIVGYTLKNVVTLRAHDDAKLIMENVNDTSHVVCFGSSFIAMEVAAYFAGKVKSVTIVSRTDVPFKQTFGDQIGQRFLQLFEEKGVRMVMGSTVVEIFGNAEGKVQKVELLDKKKIPCDIFIMGTGSELNTGFLKDSKVKLHHNNAVNVDMHCMTNIIGVYAGGDIANAPVMAHDNQRATIGHYQLAQYHGRVAARNMTGKIEELRAVPFFFTTLIGKSVRYAGYNENYKEVLIHGSLQDLKFLAYYLDENGNVLAMASVAWDPVVAQYAELLSQGKRLHRDDLKSDDPLEWTNMIKEQKARIRCSC